MPIHMSYRPHETVERRFAQGQHRRMQEAIEAAFTAFFAEFGALPKKENTCIEVAGSITVWTARVMEDRVK
jgi:hypothetical protein